MPTGWIDKLGTDTAILLAAVLVFLAYCVVRVGKWLGARDDKVVTNMTTCNETNAIANMKHADSSMTQARVAESHADSLKKISEVMVKMDTRDEKRDATDLERWVTHQAQQAVLANIDERTKSIHDIIVKGKIVPESPK